MTRYELANDISDYLINCGLNLAAFDIDSACDYICERADISAFEYYPEGRIYSRGCYYF